MSQVARYTASRPEKKATLDVLEGSFLKLLEGAKPTGEVSLDDRLVDPLSARLYA